MKIKLIGAVLMASLVTIVIIPVLAKEIDSSSPKLLNAGNSSAGLNLVCIQTAVEKRETAIISAGDTFSSAYKTALTKRKTALVAAWGMTNAKERRAARLAAWNTFRTEQRTARQAHLQAVKAAWQQFKTDATACKVDVTGVEPEGLDTAAAAAAASAANSQ